MEARMKNPAMVLPDALQAIQALQGAIAKGGVPRTILDLAHLRASQINGCSSCVDSGSRYARTSGESEDRLYAVAAWRHTTHFTEPERAALALAEAATRLADSSDPVPDDVWDEAAKHYNEEELAALVLWIAMTNFFNRLNITTGQPAGSWG